MEEVFKDIAGYEGLYQVSNLGRIKSLNYNNTNKEKILKCSKNRKGYLRLSLCKDGDRNYYRVHRLVAIHFIPNLENKPQVNHINGDKTDNRVENLEWCTCKENVNHSVRIGTFKKSCKEVI